MNVEKSYKFALGTAQLGQEYGISNKTGMPNHNEAMEILEYAMSYGIDAFDTAPTYGKSEDIIGGFIKKRKETCFSLPNIITKIPAIDQNKEMFLETIVSLLSDNITLSLKRLRIDYIDACLLHSPDDMKAFNGQVVAGLIDLKQKGLVKNIGVSIYTPAEVREAIALDCFDIIEVPINIFDQRLIRLGLLKELSEHKIKVYARSVFLQGLVFIEPENLPEYLKLAKAPLEKLKHLASQSGLKPAELSLLFVRDLPGIERIIIGCETLGQLKSNIDIMNLPGLDTKLLEKIEGYFSNISENIINPTLWKRRSP